jgi:hypothetical protein
MSHARSASRRVLVLACAVACLALAPPGPAQAAPAVPDAAAITHLVQAILVRDRATGAIDPSGTPVTLWIASLRSLPRADRRVIDGLRRRHLLGVRHGGAMNTLSDPQTPDDSVSGVPAQSATAATGYPGPNIGGVRYYLGTSAQYYACTAGFPVANGFGYFTATAGHCGPAVNTPIWSVDAEPWASQITPYDHTRFTTWSTPTGPVIGDVSSFSIPSTLPVIRISSNQVRYIRGGEDPTLLENDVCFRGATSTTERCGNVSRVNQAIVIEGRSFSAFCIYKLAALGGDSGSPLYKKVGTSDARIRGVLSFVWDTDGDGAYDTTCGTPVSAVLRATSSSLVTM